MKEQDHNTEQSMADFWEQPLEYLRRKDGERFDIGIVQNWYKARAFVLEKLKNISFKPDEDRYLHVIVTDDSPLMLSVVRQVALSAHYFNYDEDKIEYKGDKEDTPHNNRTIITINSTSPDIKKELEKEEYLYNLPRYCKFVDRNHNVENGDSFIDVEIHVVDEVPENEDSYSERWVFSEENVNDFCKAREAEGANIFRIDTRKAVYAGRMYDLGGEIDNIPAEDIHCAERYFLALNYYQNEKLKKGFETLVDKDAWEGKINPCIIKEKVSNIFCSDCFESRVLGIKKYPNKENLSEKELWEKYNEALSKSEHARWVVEKLILGYSPLNAQQRFKDESLAHYKVKRKAYRKHLKRDPVNPAHIDLCSYADVRRVDPDNLKYDSFLMLAIPKILEKINKEDNNSAES